MLLGLHGGVGVHSLSLRLCLSLELRLDLSMLLLVVNGFLVREGGESLLLLRLEDSGARRRR